MGCVISKKDNFINYVNPKMINRIRRDIIELENLPEIQTINYISNNNITIKLNNNKIYCFTITKDFPFNLAK
jgi:hypothetical protein